jgi:hypothetical protein
MEKLIEALQIFLKYKNEQWPTHCEHDVLHIIGVTQEEVSEEDTEKLKELGFFWSDDNYGWISYRYGSA